MGHLISFIQSLIDNWQWTLYFTITGILCYIIYWKGDKWFK